MPRIQAPSQSAPAQPASVDASVSVSEQGDGSRLVTFRLPAKREYTHDELVQLAEREGRPVKAVCDISGEPIFYEKNVNEVSNSEREEFNGLIMSTKIMKALVQIAEM